MRPSCGGSKWRRALSARCAICEVQPVAQRLHQRLLPGLARGGQRERRGRRAPSVPPDIAPGVIAVIRSALQRCSALPGAGVGRARRHRDIRALQRSRRAASVVSADGRGVASCEAREDGEAGEFDAAPARFPDAPAASRATGAGGITTGISVGISIAISGALAGSAGSSARGGLAIGAVARRPRAPATTPIASWPAVPPGRDPAVHQGPASARRRARRRSHRRCRPTRRPPGPARCHAPRGRHQRREGQHHGRRGSPVRRARTVRLAARRAARRQSRRRRGGRRGGGVGVGRGGHRVIVIVMLAPPCPSRRIPHARTTPGAAAASVPASARGARARAGIRR